MSSPLPSARITSPLQLVRPLSEEALDDSHVSKTPETLPQAITPSGITLDHSRANSSTPITSISSTSAELLPQLSERDSIFATHYLPTESAATTPRLQPTQRGKHDLHQDVAANLELSKPLPSSASKPTLLSHKTRSSSAIASLTSSIQSSYWQAGLTSISTSTPNSPNEPSVLLGNSVDASRSRGIGSLPPTKSHPSSHYHRTKSYGALSYLRMSETWNQPSRTDRTKTKEHEEIASTGAEKPPSDRRKRSSSRDTVEKGIEATLANEEPVSNARSRKASHYLRLFKENTDVQEQKRGKDKSRDVSSHDGNTDATRLKPGIRGAEADDGERTANGETAVSDGPKSSFQAEGFNDGRAARRNTQITEATEPRRAFRSDSVGRQPVRPSTEISNQHGTDEGILRVSPSIERQNFEWYSSNLSEQEIPFRLLEEIRNHPHRPSFPKDNSYSQDIQSRKDGRWLGADAFAENDRLEPIDNEFGSEGKHTDLDGEEYESNKEHISSAVYYPHQAASPDSSDTNLEQTESSDDIDDVIRKPNFRPTELGAVLEESRLPTDEVTIAIQSQDEKQCFYGDLPPLQITNSPEQSGKQGEALTSSASDTDYESWDETGQSARGEDLGIIDEGDATPNANPSILRYASHFKKRHRAPLGAVELKPYKHQVGGHSTVFHFSKRAVCKQLSNRENEFYEVLERRHPELLKFLPRYVFSVHAQSAVSFCTSERP